MIAQTRYYDVWFEKPVQQLQSYAIMATFTKGDQKEYAVYNHRELRIITHPDGGNINKANLLYTALAFEQI